MTSRPRTRLAASRSRAGQPALAAVALVVVSLAVFAALLLSLEGARDLLPLDAEARRIAGAAPSSALARTAEIVTLLGGFEVAAAVILIAAGSLALSGHPRLALILALGLVCVALGTDLAKAAVGRLRPSEASPSLTTASFPSGHASHSTAYVAVALAVAGALGARRGRRLLLVACGAAIALAVGATRVVLGAHYLSDVLAGWAFGAAVFGLVAALVFAVDSMRHTEDRTQAAVHPDSPP